MSEASPAPRVLVVDDDALVADSLCEFLRAEGLEPQSVSDVAAALERAREAEREDRPFALVLTDVSLPGESGLELVKRLHRDHPASSPIVLTGYGSIESAVSALRLGAVDYLTKPVVDAELRMAIERGLRQHALVWENHALRRRLDQRQGLASVVGRDPRMLRIFDMIHAVASSRSTVLMTGESGTGKSLIARAIHDASPRRQRPFVEISCGSIPETLLESELFGHVKGAFTGAHTDKVGRFLAAHEGTLFLDEINSASPGMQLKLLRVLQERKFEPVGSTLTTEVDVRVVLASNQPLEPLVAQGLFRQDLYYRINVVNIDLPPLRDRSADVPELAEFFLRRHAMELDKQIAGFSPEAVELLRRYRFPGNIRELQNIVERAAVLCARPTIMPEDLPPHVRGETALRHVEQADPAEPATPGDEAWVPMPLEEALREPERRILLKALRANAWNRQKTADQLGINRTTLYKKMKDLGIEPREDAA